MKYKHHIYKILKKVINWFGLDFVIKRKMGFLEHGNIFVDSNYSPWKTDKEFNEVYDKIKDYSLVHKDRLFELWDLVKQSSKLKEGSLIEVGVWKGGSAALISKQSELCNIKEKVYLCDGFNGVVKAGKEDITYIGGEHCDATKEDVKEIINSLKLDNVEILEGVFPDETGYNLSEKKFRFCHIDVDVYESAKDVFDWIWDRMVIGGIIVFDDYGFRDCYGVTKFVNEQRNKKGNVVFHNLNGHGVIIKLKEEEI